ncbi:aldehyde dehydrogenase family protein [Egibacter rhizosphaerae]|uniref:Aldehyde dehydrogenase family protein n=1 Tax=Egibacter rhizosphaerae TaxID=1670831 RepID=A0A411YDJ9_9ACTN|nr:aldehyde dehydrogenase family protein [Egibacter rhizosphaerae]
MTASGDRQPDPRSWRDGSSPGPGRTFEPRSGSAFSCDDGHPRRGAWSVIGRALSGAAASGYRRCGQPAVDLREPHVSHLYLAGEWRGAEAGARRDVINPYDASVVRTVDEGDDRDVRAAIAAAREAFDRGEWPHLPGADRGRVVAHIADLIERDREELAQLETSDTGKTLVESRMDMDDIASVFRYYAGLADKEAGEVVDAPVASVRSVVHREPIGVVGQISPWNFPLLQASWKLAPALAAGCALVAKPSELTPLSTIKVFELIDEAGVPPGVANLVLGPGDPVGAELAASHDVDLISFTGGIGTGRRIMEAAAGNVKKVALELGGKNPNVVFADADLDTAVDYALLAVFLHAGQVCSAGARLLVERPVADEVTERLIERTRRIRLGRGTEPDTEMGPLISAAHRDKVEAFVEEARAEGCEIPVGGRRPDHPELQKGFFYEPTIVLGCAPDQRIITEEVFGPVLTVETFDTEQEALELANGTTYGLAGAAWTRDVARAERMARGLRLGTVWINDYHPYYPQAPWGGYKQSGIGRENGRLGLEEYQEVKHVSTNLAPEATGWFGSA